MFTRLKICGITSLDDAFSAVNCGVDFIGFNFYPQSPRYISPSDAKKIIHRLPFYVQTVGIFVQADFEEIIKIVRDSGISAVQIHEPKEEIDFNSIPLPVILGLRLKKQIKNFKLPDGVNMVLVDRFSTTQFGGTGETFNWQIIPEDIPKEKLILAGGINSENIETALKEINPAVIDVASGSEKMPGVKDPGKIKTLMQKIIEHNLEAMKDG